MRQQQCTYEAGQITPWQLSPPSLTKNIVRAFINKSWSVIFTVQCSLFLLNTKLKYCWPLHEQNVTALINFQWAACRQVSMSQLLCVSSMVRHETLPAILSALSLEDASLSVILWVEAVAPPPFFVSLKNFKFTGKNFKFTGKNFKFTGMHFSRRIVYVSLITTDKECIMARIPSGWWWWLNI